MWPISNCPDGINIKLFLLNSSLIFTVPYIWFPFLSAGKCCPSITVKISDLIFPNRENESLKNILLDLLKENGKMAIVLPDGIFGNETLSYLRNWING